MNRHDLKNLAKAGYAKVFAHPRTSVVVVGLMIGIMLSIVSGSDDTPLVVGPVKIVPYPVVDFELANTKYDGYDIPTSIHRNYKKELRCMSRNLYFEARDQELQGRIAVGLVTLNRTNSKNFPNSICEVVWQKRWSKRYGKWVAQFSWTLDGKSDAPIENEAYLEAVRVASALLAGGITDFTNGADHYHAYYVSPHWATKLKLVAKIDDHLFYLEPPKKTLKTNKL